MSRHYKPIANKEIRPINGRPFPTAMHEPINRRAVDLFQIRGEIPDQDRENRFEAER